MEKSALQLLRDEQQARTGPMLGRGCGPGGVVVLGGHSQLSQAKVFCVVMSVCCVSNVGVSRGGLLPW